MCTAYTVGGHNKYCCSPVVVVVVHKSAGASMGPETPKCALAYRRPADRTEDDPSETRQLKTRVHKHRRV